MNEEIDHSLGSKPEKNLDGLIDAWAPELRDEWTADGRLGPDDFRGMHRTSLITIARGREIQAAADRARALNALWGNVNPDLIGKDRAELLAIAQPSEEEIAKLNHYGLLEQRDTA